MTDAFLLTILIIAFFFLCHMNSIVLTVICNIIQLLSSESICYALTVTVESQICINILQMPYLLFTPYLIYHVATDKPSPAQNGDKFRSIFSDNLQPIATRGKKARGTLLVDKHCENGCSIKRAPLSVSYYNEISGGHIGRAVVRRRFSTGPVLPL